MKISILSVRRKKRIFHFFFSCVQRRKSVSLLLPMWIVKRCLTKARNDYLSMAKSFQRSNHNLQVLTKFSGIFYLIAANFIFTCYTFAFKTMPMDIANAMIIRQGVQAFIFGTYARYYKKYKLLEHNGHTFTAILNILTSSGTNMSYMIALYFLPLSTLNTIKHTYMIWAAILSIGFLKDRFSCITFCSVLLALLGLTLTTEPELFIDASHKVKDIR